MIQDSSDPAYLTIEHSTFDCRSRHAQPSAASTYFTVSEDHTCHGWDRAAVYAGRRYERKEKVMQHGRVAIYHVKPEHNLDDVSRIAEEGMLPIFRDQPGFVGYGLVKVDEGQRIVSLSFWETEAAAEKAVPLAADFVRSKLAEYIHLEENHVGDLTFYGTAGKLGS